jgi:rod shape-determining protein MreB
MAIDLGTVHTRVYAKDRGIVFQEPSVVTMNTRTGNVVALGRDARHMIDKTPPHLTTHRPITKGVIADFEVAEQLLTVCLESVHQGSWSLLPRPRVVMTVPLEMTEVERKAAEDAALSAGARDVFLVEAPMAGALGARMPVMESVGNFVIDFGGGMTQMAVVSLGGVVTWKSITTGGEELNRMIVQYARDVFGLLVGEQVAEEVKMRIGSAIASLETNRLPLRGRDALSGLPREVQVTDAHIREALAPSVRTMIDAAKSTIERTPPELVADVYERGIVLYGGGALLKGIDELLAKELQVPVRVAEDPTTCLVRGAGSLLDQQGLLADIALPSTVVGRQPWWRRSL